MNANDFVVCVDAGHGGLNKGIGPDKYVTYPSKCFQHKHGKFHSYGWFFEGVFNRSLANFLEHFLLDYGFQVKKVYEPINDTSLNKRCHRSQEGVTLFNYAVRLLNKFDCRNC